MNRLVVVSAVSAAAVLMSAAACFGLVSEKWTISGPDARKVKVLVTYTDISGKVVKLKFTGTDNTLELHRVDSGVSNNYLVSVSSAGEGLHLEAAALGAGLVRGSAAKLAASWSDDVDGVIPTVLDFGSPPGTMSISAASITAAAAEGVYKIKSGTAGDSIGIKLKMIITGKISVDGGERPARVVITASGSNGALAAGIDYPALSRELGL